MMPWRLAVALLGGIGLTSHWQCAAFSAGKACTDTEGWSDSYGDCAAYNGNDWCTINGKAGLGWNPNWGTLDPAAVLNCCACGKAPGLDDAVDPDAPDGGFNGPCDPNPCDNVAKCTDVGGEAQCVCDVGWAGPTCDEEVEYNESTDGTGAWDGPFMEMCGADTCLNNGVCHTDKQTEDTVCVCTGGFQGDYCEDAPGFTPDGGINGPCDPDPCSNSGVCHLNTKGGAVEADEDENTTCTCVNGYTGNHCDTEPADTHT